MTGFDELVERARREFAEQAAADATARTGAALASASDRFDSDLARELLVIDGNSEPFLLRSEAAGTPLRRFLGSFLRRLLRSTGLGKFLGSNQFQVNQAVLRGLRSLHVRVQEQDSILIEFANELSARRRGEDVRDSAQ